jgi:hypothetical protein
VPTLRITIAILCAAGQVACVQAGQPYLVSELATGNIWRIEDTNGDSDALDVGERTLWSDSSASLVGLDIVGGTVYAVERGLVPGNNEIIKLVDNNGDGDALDVGERDVWATGLNDPRDVVHDASGNLYVSDFGTSEVWRLVDSNGDGDALDVGESTLFADGIAGAEMLLPWAGGMLITAGTPGELILLDDVNSDGDALDVAESTTIVSGINNALGILSDGDGGFYVASFGDDTVYRAADNNGDGDFLDVGEVLSYADLVFGSLNGPWSMADHPAGGFLLTNFIDGEVLLTSDNNGDGDALDLGEVTLFADGLSQPVDFVALVEVYDADFDEDGDVDGFDFLTWQRGFGTDAGEGNIAPLANGNANGDQFIDSIDLAFWENQYGTGRATLSAAAAVPEPSMLLLASLAGLLCCTRRRMV